MKRKEAKPTEEKPKKKMGVIRKLLLAIGCVLLALVIAFTGFIVYETHRPSAVSTGEKTTETTTAVEYLAVPKSDIKTAPKAAVTVTPLKEPLNTNGVERVLKKKRGYTMEKYYALDAALKKYRTTTVTPKVDTSLLDSHQNIDAQKLYQQVLKNNEEAKKSRQNIYYADAEPQEIKTICELVANICNDSKEDRDITQTASILMNLKICRHMTSTSLAAVNKDLVFQFNPSMISVTAIAKNLTKQLKSEDDIKVGTFVHETEHLKQWASSDMNAENGCEAGFCRDYQDDETIPVNSLWDQWVLEAAAEMKMAEQMHINPWNYARKLTYVHSYQMMRIFEDDIGCEALINATFTDDLDAAFKALRIEGEKEQRAFLNLMYTIQTGQYDCDDFWDYYQKEKGVTLSEEERASLRRDVRADAIYDMTARFYTSLMTAVRDGKIRDAETVYFMMKLWELDSGGHLAYTKKADFENAKELLRWEDALKTALLKAVAAASGKSESAVKKAYLAYHPFVNDNGKRTENFRFYQLSDEKTAYIRHCFDSYSVTHFTDVAEMIQYMDKKK